MVNNESIERPPVEFHQARVQAELADSTRADEECSGQEHGIVERFRYGVRRFCAIDVWKRLIELAQVDSHERFADRFEMSSALVSRGLSHGALSIDYLVVMITELRLMWGNLDPLPPIVDRAIAGYVESMCWLAQSRGRTDMRIVPADFQILHSVCHQFGKWFAAENAVQLRPDDSDARTTLQFVLDNIRVSAQTRFGYQLPHLDAERCRLLVKDWCELFFDCYIAISYQWLAVQDVSESAQPLLNNKSSD